MKLLVALAVVALAAADSDSFYPGSGYPYQQTGFPFAGHRNFGYRMPYNFHQPQPFQHQLPFMPFQQQHAGQQRLFRRDADSDSKSFYPGFPFVPPTPYYGQSPYYHQQQQTPYFHHQQAAAPYMHRPYNMPMPVQQFTTYSHPMMYNPLLKVAEEKKYETTQEHHKLQKRESDSDSFYPGYPFAPPSPYYGHYAMPQQHNYGMHQQAYGMPHQQTYGLPNVVPRVLPYSFPGMQFNNYQQNPFVRTFKPVIGEKKEQE